MKPILAALFFLFAANVPAQESAAELIRHMNGRYASAQSISMHFEANYYATAAQASPATSVKGEVHCRGNNYYSDAMGQLIVSNKNYTLLVDRNERTITCLPGHEQKKDDVSAGSVPGGLPDSAWLAAAKLRLLDKTGTSQRIEIIEEGGLYEKTELTINTLTYALEEVVYYYRKLENGAAPKLTVTYTSVAIDEPISDAFFSEKKYIQKKNGKLIAAPAWNGYQVIDLTQGIEP